MRILESAPDRYDAAMRLLTLGRLGRAYDRLASHVQAGQRVLDIGCGTGALTVRAARRGARVKAIDINPQMIEIAARHVREQGLMGRVEFAEVGVAELDAEESGSRDVVMSGLCFSELSADERAFALRQAARILRVGGQLLIADEVRARRLPGRLVQSMLRAPLSFLTYLIAGQTTHAIGCLPEGIAAAGFQLESVREGALGGMCEIVARKPDGSGS